MKLGDEQFARDAGWKVAGRLALLGMGDPYLAPLDQNGMHHAMVEMKPGAHRPA